MNIFYYFVNEYYGTSGNIKTQVFHIFFCSRLKFCLHSWGYNDILVNEKIKSVLSFCKESQNTILWENS